MASVLLPPVVLEVDGCKVYIFNVIKTKNVYGETRYIVSCRVEYRGHLSKQFILDVANSQEFMRKLKYEVALFRSIVLAGAYDKYR